AYPRLLSKECTQKALRISYRISRFQKIEDYLHQLYRFLQPEFNTRFEQSEHLIFKSFSGEIIYLGGGNYYWQA
ncbi:hypothetical protein HMI54_000893, partial [Coelomomyces lativittatus]